MHKVVKRHTIAMPGTSFPKQQLVCFSPSWLCRRYGHNEIDEPMFTQPNMYKVVKTHPNPLDVYSKKLLGQKIVTPEEVPAADGPGAGTACLPSAVCIPAPMRTPASMGLGSLSEDGSLGFCVLGSKHHHACNPLCSLFVQSCDGRSNLQARVTLTSFCKCIL